MVEAADPVRNARRRGRTRAVLHQAATLQERPVAAKAAARRPRAVAPPHDARRTGPESVTAIAADSPDRFINRELSWLDFNQRVVEEADNPRNPLLERLRFLSISAGNLDEFYSVRVAGLVGQVRETLSTRSPDGRTPAQQLAAVEERARALLAEQQRIWRELRAAMAREGVVVCDPRTLEEEARSWIETFFMDRIFPVLTPLAIDPAHPFPFIPNMGQVLALRLLRDDDDRHAMSGLVMLPAQVERFIRLPSGVSQDTGGGEIARFMLLEDLVSQFLDRLFPGFHVGGRGVFRIIRDTDVEFEEEAEDLVRSYETALKRRRRGVVIHLDVNAEMPADLAALVADELDVPTEEMQVHDGLIGIVDVKQLIVDDRTDLLFAPYAPRFPERIRDFGGDCFRGHPRQGHHRPPSVREFRRGGAVPAPGRTRPGRGGDQADPVSHLARQPDRQGADRGGGERQIRDRHGGAARALRRGGEYPSGPHAGGRRRAGGVRLRRAEDTCETQPGGAARRRRGAQLRPFRHRQLPSDHRAHLYRPQLLYLRDRAGTRLRAAVQLHDRLCAAGLDGRAGVLAADHALHPDEPDRSRDRLRACRQARADLAQDELAGR